MSVKLLCDPYCGLRTTVAAHWTFHILSSDIEAAQLRGPIATLQKRTRACASLGLSFRSCTIFLEFYPCISSLYYFSYHPLRLPNTSNQASLSSEWMISLQVALRASCSRSHFFAGSCLGMSRAERPSVS